MPHNLSGCSARSKSSWPLGWAFPINDCLVSEKRIDSGFLSKVPFDQRKNLRRVILVGKNMDSLSPWVLQFISAPIHIDVGLKMLPVRRFVMEHQFIVVKEDVVTVVQIVISLILSYSTSASMVTPAFEVSLFSYS